MFRLIQSNSIESLAEALAQQLKANTPKDPFCAQKVLVSTNAMGRWLALALSEQLGICAGIDFDFGGRYFRNLVRQLAAQPNHCIDPWEPDAMRWRLAQLLFQLPQNAIYNPLHLYWQADKNKTDTNRPKLNRQQLQFLLQLTDTFDQYGLYRAAAMRRWLAEEDLDFQGQPLPADQLWQPHLLRELHNQAKLLGFNHPSERLLAAPQQIANATSLKEQWHAEGPLQVFGLSSLPPAFLDLLATIASQGPREVVLYLLSPCDCPWGATPAPIDKNDSSVEQLEKMLLHEGHPLLANLGRTLRDFDWQLELISTNLEENFHRLSLTPAPIAKELNLLDQLKLDLATGKRRSPLNGQRQPLLITTAQLNLQVIHCHGDRRQVEEAHEAVLALMASDPSLQPREILLLTTDVARFAPLVLASFERPGGISDPRHLPIRVTDRTLRQRNAKIDLLFRLLALAGSRYELEAVLDLLLLPPVAEALQLNELEAQQWLRSIQALGVTWGRDAEHRQKWGYPICSQYSWQWGLDRLLLGLLLEDPFPIGNPADGEWQGLAAHGDPMLTPPLVLALIAACESLFTFLRPLESAQTPEAWVVALTNAVQVLSGSGGPNNWQTPELFELLKPLRAAPENAPALEREAVVLLLEEAEAQEQGRYGHVSGAVTLSALEPMRSIPHRVVVLLGMDEERLPRPDHSPQYNLIAAKPWRGDRSRRQEDRAILLETLQASRHHWIATFTGTDPCTGEQRNPAGPLADLISCLASEYRSSAGKPITDLLLRYAAPLRQLPANPKLPLEAIWPQTLNWPKSDTKTIELASSEELQQFFNDPAKQLLQAHGIQLQRKPEQQFDPEETELNGLRRWQLGEHFLNHGFEDLQLAALQRRGLLPAGPAAPVVSADLARRSLQLLEIQQQLEESQPTGLFLTGSGQLKPKRLLQGWITHLFANQIAPRYTHLIGPQGSGEKEKLLAIALAPLEQSTAIEHLELLQHLRREGLCRLLPFEPQLSWWLLQEKQNPGGNKADIERLQWPDSIIQINAGEPPDLEIWWAQAECWSLVEQILLPLAAAIAKDEITRAEMA